MSVILRDEEAEEYTLNIVSSAEVLQKFRLRWNRIPVSTKIIYPANDVVEEGMGTFTIKGYRYSDDTQETFKSLIDRCSDIIGHSLGFECWVRSHVDTPEWTICKIGNQTDSCLEITETIHYKMNSFGVLSTEFGNSFVCRNKPSVDTEGVKRIAGLQSLDVGTFCNRFRFNNDDPNNTFWIYSPEGFEYGDFSYTNNIYKKHKIKTAPRAIFL